MVRIYCHGGWVLTRAREVNAEPAEDEAIRRLTVHYHNRDVDALVGELEDAVRGDMRTPTLWGMRLLGRLKDPRAIAPVTKILSHPDPWLRIRAARVLGKIGSTDATSMLIGGLGDANERVQVAAAEALGSLRDPAAVPALTMSARHRRKAVRRAATAALARIEREAVSQKRRADPKSKNASLKRLIRRVSRRDPTRD
jgi:HEAT repeat protein